MFGQEWYTDAQRYWANVDASVDGMLGGFQELHAPDIKASRQLLESIGFPLRQKGDGRSPRACDCGAGIGRITKGLLMHCFDSVDMVEVTEQFLKQAESDATLSGRVERFINIGLEGFNPEHDRYDVIWCQWVLGHLTDDDLKQFLVRCLEAVKGRGGYVVVKENYGTHQDYLVDDEDSSVTRSEAVWKRLFNESGATIVKEELQTGFPPHLFKVKSWVLQ